MVSQPRNWHSLYGAIIIGFDRGNLNQKEGKKRSHMATLLVHLIR